jgi:hypothetical protein
MKAILSRKILGDNEAYIENMGWRINILDDDVKQTYVRFAIEGLVKEGNEIKLIDFSIREETTLDNMLNEVSLHMVERFFNDQSYAVKGGDVKGEEPKGNVLKANPERLHSLLAKSRADKKRNLNDFL